MTETPNRTGGRSPLAEAVANSDEGIVLTQMLIVADVGRSVAFYHDVLGATVERDSAPAMLRFHNGWLVLNVGGGPTEDKPQITVTPPGDPDTVSAFLNIRVADIEAVYKQWSTRGAQFITEPMERGLGSRSTRSSRSSAWASITATASACGSTSLRVSRTTSGPTCPR
jgi:predicted enzyme related to lactoylglutathione lyase